MQGSSPPVEANAADAKGQRLTGSESSNETVQFPRRFAGSERWPPSGVTDAMATSPRNGVPPVCVLLRACAAGAAAALCGAAGDQGLPGGTAGRRAHALLLGEGGRAGQSSAASENHRRGSGGCNQTSDIVRLIVGSVCV